jgi:DNA replication protein
LLKSGPWYKSNKNNIMTESNFSGFPPRVDVTPLPNLFFSELLPLMENTAEIKVLMHIFFLLSRRRGFPKFVSYQELSSDPIIIKSLSALTSNMNDILKESLELAVKHRVLISIPITINDRSDHAYFINNLSEKETFAKIADGMLKIPDIAIRKEEPITVDESDIYNLYEQNIGMLTPIMAEELQDAEHRYPPDWIQDAFKEAVRANVRNWKYINSILKRWEREGKKDGQSVRDSRKERDPDKYVRGKHGHVVRR